MFTAEKVFSQHIAEKGLIPQRSHLNKHLSDKSNQVSQESEDEKLSQSHLGPSFSRPQETTQTQKLTRPGLLAGLKDVSLFSNANTVCNGDKLERRHARIQIFICLSRSLGIVMHDDQICERRGCDDGLRMLM
jgi:hypothetical protein